MMTNEELLKANLNKFFEFTFSDGETTVGRLLRVNERNNEFVYEMSSTNEPRRYHNRLGKYAASIADLVSAELLDKE
jgi:hypothetical protein